MRHRETPFAAAVPDHVQANQEQNHNDVQEPLDGLQVRIVARCGSRRVFFVLWLDDRFGRIADAGRQADLADDVTPFADAARALRRDPSVEVANGLDPATLDGVRAWCTAGSRG